MAFGGLQKGVKQMLIQELFSKGIMKMGPSPVDPQRQVGVFNPEAIAGLPALRTQEMEKFLWLVGEWNYKNAVPPTPSSPAYGDIGTAKYALSEDRNWLCSVSPDGRQSPQITFDPLSQQWIYVLTRGSYGVLRSAEGWCGDQISFSGKMTMVGINCDWRLTWTRQSSDRFFFVNEERNEDGSWAYIDEWRFQLRS